jgi:hypothetical protein
LLVPSVLGVGFVVVGRPGAPVLDFEQRLDERLDVADAVEAGGQVEVVPVERAVAGAQEVPGLDGQGVVSRQGLGFVARVLAVAVGS